MKTLAALALVAAIGLGQGKKEFEVASIRPIKDPQQQTAVQAGIRIDGAQVTMAAFSLSDAMRGAYRVKGYQIVGPDWVSSDRFDFQAKIPTDGKPDEVGEMIRNLIEDRFQMKYHREKKEFSAYVLTVAKGANIKATQIDADTATAPVNITGGGSAAGVNINWGRGRSLVFADNKLTATKADLPSFVDAIERFLDRPIVDQTGLTGNYDLSIDLTQEDYTAMLIRSAINAGITLPPQALRALDLGSMDSLFRGLEKAGLKLEAKKAPLEVIVVDQARRTPTDN